MPFTADYDKWQKEQQKEWANKRHKQQYQKNRQEWEKKNSPQGSTTLNR